MFGVDYSSGTPNLNALKGAGVQFVCRYLSTPGNPKNLTKREVFGLDIADIKIVTVFETTGGRALSGAKGGVVDARSAQAQLTALGAPVDAPVYFAVDFDVPDFAPHLADIPKNARAKLGPIAGYFDGVHAGIGNRRVGAYGGYWVIKRLFDAGLIDYGWQAFAWSGGRWDQRAHLRQTRNGQHLGGVEVDFNSSMKPDFGQWFAAPTPVPHPKPKPKPTPPVVFPKDDTFWTWLRWRTGSGEFEVYGPRAKQVRPNVPQRIPAAWWRALSFYLKNRPSA